MNTEKAIEMDKIKELWMYQAVTDFAKEEIRNTKIYLSETALKRSLKDTTDARNFLEQVGAVPLQNVTEMKEIIQIADKGDCLTPYRLERVEKILVATKRLKDYLVRGKAYQNALAYYEENLQDLANLREEIAGQIRNGEVDDYASKELAKIREQIGLCKEQMKQKAEQIMRTHKECMADTYYTLRNDRVCIPVKKEHKLKITGSVIDKSSTGSTLFIEPAGVAKYYEQIQILKLSEENEVYRILYTLTAMVAESIPILEGNIAMMEKLDFIFSKGKLSLEMEATEPSINTEKKIILTQARHPLMDKNAAVPLQFEIGDRVQGIVITGPNTGGKTVAIKTVMLNCIMAQCGLHVTCKEADICMNSAYFCDIGDGQNLSENLSTFSAHITNVLDIMKEVNHNSFVIMDELGSGTDPTEGMGIAIAILEELKKSGALFLVTTHYPDVKEYAEQTSGMVNARMSFDKETLSPTYQMIIGEAGESCAFYIADRLGMPNEMLRTAIKAAYGEQAADAYQFQTEEKIIQKRNTTKIVKSKKATKTADLHVKFSIGDSVMVYPEKKIGIVCEPVNEKGVLRVQLQHKKIWINHKRVKLHVSAKELYPEDYDFSILFETVENRKKLHDMQRKYTEEVVEYDADTENKKKR